MINGFIQEQSVNPDSQDVTFSVDLDSGPTLLHTWFDNEEFQPICGAYYVYVTRR